MLFCYHFFFFFFFLMRFSLRDVIALFSIFIAKRNAKAEGNIAASSLNGRYFSKAIRSFPLAIVPFFILFYFFFLTDFN